MLTCHFSGSGNWIRHGQLVMPICTYTSGTCAGLAGAAGAPGKLSPSAGLSQAAGLLDVVGWGSRFSKRTSPIVQAPVKSLRMSYQLGSHWSKQVTWPSPESVSVELHRV